MSDSSSPKKSPQATGAGALAGARVIECGEGVAAAFAARLLAGDIATAKTILRDYINATVGFTELAQATHIPSKSLMRMLGPTGNPRADNLFEVVSFLQQREGVRFHVKAAPI